MAMAPPRFLNVPIDIVSLFGDNADIFLTSTPCGLKPVRGIFFGHGGFFRIIAPNFNLFFIFLLLCGILVVRTWSDGAGIAPNTARNKGEKPC